MGCSLLPPTFTILALSLRSDLVAVAQQRGKKEWMCHTLHELYDEMELWEWDSVQHNRWARALKASNQVKVRPMWYMKFHYRYGFRHIVVH